MKTAICIPPGGTIYRENQYDSFRGEGRFTINIGFGLSLIGYEVHIISNWNLKEPKKVWNNVYIYNKPIYDTYDISFTFSHINGLYNTKFKKGIFMGYELKHIDNAIEFTKNTQIPLTFVCPYKCLIEHNNKIAPFKVYYLPQLMPIPSTNIGFLPYNYHPETSELKIYLNFSQWENTTSSHPQWSIKQDLIINYLKERYPEKKIILYVHIEDKDAISVCHIQGDETYYFLNNKNYYDDVIKLIKSVDICITRGNLYIMSGCVNDIISLGKPFIYICDGIPTGTHIVNHLYNCPKSIIYSQESDTTTLIKTERFLNNPELSYNCFKYESRDMEFNNWKEIAKIIFNCQDNN